MTYTYDELSDVAKIDTSYEGLDRYRDIEEDIQAVTETTFPDWLYVDPFRRPSWSLSTYDDYINIPVYVDGSKLYETCNACNACNAPYLERICEMVDWFSSRRYTYQFSIGTRTDTKSLYEVFEYASSWDLSEYIGLETENDFIPYNKIPEMFNEVDGAIKDLSKFIEEETASAISGLNAILEEWRNPDDEYITD